MKLLEVLLLCSAFAVNAAVQEPEKIVKRENLEGRDLSSSSSKKKKKKKQNSRRRKKWSSSSSKHQWSSGSESKSSSFTEKWNPLPPIRPAVKPLALPKRRSDSMSDDHGIKNIYLEVTNLGFNEPFSSFFVLVHDAHTTPLFEAGKPASQNLGELALNGHTQPLVDFYGYQAGVVSVGAISTGGMRKFVISLQISPKYECVTIAAMMVNTNDSFVSLNGAPMYHEPVGRNFFEPAYDAGVEANDELCRSIPGPACDEEPGNKNDGGGEGVVHITRPLSGIGDLSPNKYGWLNPMMQVRYLDEIPALHGMYRI
jgi:hypothetical protein